MPWCRRCRRNAALPPPRCAPQCPNGKECKYRHALPPGYVLKSQMKELLELEAANVSWGDAVVCGAQPQQLAFACLIDKCYEHALLVLCEQPCATAAVLLHSITTHARGLVILTVALYALHSLHRLLLAPSLFSA